MPAPGFRSLSISVSTIKNTNELRRKVEALPSQAKLIDLAVRFAQVKEREFVRWADKELEE